MPRATRAEWAVRVRDWRASGECAREYGARHRLNPRTLLWWSSRLGRSLPAAPTFVEVVPAVPRAEASRIEVAFPTGARVLVVGPCDAAALRTVLGALGGR